MATVKSTSEEWRPVIGYEGYYAISNYGCIKRVKLPRATLLNGILTPSLNKFGYLQVSLCRNSHRTIGKLHCLVAAAFIGKRPPGFAVNHKDGNKTNNHVDNLEYVTYAANTRHAVEHGLISTRALHPRARLTEDDVIIIRDLIAHGHRVRSIASRFNISPSVIYDIKKGKTWKLPTIA